MINNVYNQFREKRIFLRIFLSIFSLSIFFIVLVSSIGFTWLQNLTLNASTHDEKTLLVNYESVFNEYLDSAKLTAETLYKNVYIKRLIVNNERNWNDTMSITANTILNVLKSNSKYHSVYIIGSNGILINANNISKIPNENLDRKVLEVFSQSYSHKINTWSYVAGVNFQEELLCITIGELDNGFKYSNGIAININCRTISQELFKNVNSDDYFFIVDASGNILLSNSEEFEFEQSINKQPYYNLIFESNNSFSPKKIEYNNRSYMISSLYNTKYGYNIVHLQPHNIFIKPLLEIRNVIIITGLVLIISSFLLSSIFSLRAYNPINSFINQIVGRKNSLLLSRSKSEKNELTEISTKFSNLSQELNEVITELELEQLKDYFTTNDVAPEK